MKLSVIGTGYVGLVSGACFAQLGNEVICVDNNQEKIDLLLRGVMPIYEPGLKELVESNCQEGKLSFTTNLKEAVENSQIIFVAVGTPSLHSGAVDMSYVETVAKDIARYMNDYKVVVIKSTVPVGTNEKIKKMIEEITPQQFSMVSNPEFLREGSAINDTMHPERIVIGREDVQAEELLTKLHQVLNAPILVTDIKSAEMIKHASNAFLATKISFINEIANICEKTGANVEDVAKGMGMDSRIGSKFLQAGIGYGGSCFPKDTKALVKIAGQVDHDFKLLKAVIEVNQNQRFIVIEKLEKTLGNLAHKTIGVLGLAFKPNTDDVRESPALDLIPEMQKRGAKVKVYDPIAMEEAKKHLFLPLTYCQTPYEAVKDAEAVVLLTEWDDFKKLNLAQIKNLVAKPIVIDGRNIFKLQEMQQLGFEYYSIGR